MHVSRDRLRPGGRGVMAAVMAVALLTAGSPVASADAAADAAAPSQLQQDVDFLRDIGTTGVLAEVSDGLVRTRARSGVAAIGSPTPVAWGSHFRIGSTTKTFVSTVMLQLVGEGRLTLEDTVEHWLPGLVQGHGHHGEHITVRQLLQHTSGVFDYVSDEDFTNTLLTPESFYANRFNTYTPQQLVAIAMQHAPTNGPGAQWSYSNTNYIIAGLIIQAVTGRTWATEVKQRIIVPFGLTETSEPGASPNLPAPFPRGYELFDETRTYVDTTLHNMTWGGSAGALISTPHDINTFWRALLGGRLLHPAQLSAMLTTVPLGPGYEDIWPGGAYGLGIFRTDLPCGGFYWHHGGDVIGYSDTNGVLPGGQRSVMVASSTNTFMDPVFAEDAIAGANQLVWHALCAGGATALPAIPLSAGSADGGQRLPQLKALPRSR